MENVIQKIRGWAQKYAPGSEEFSRRVRRALVGFQDEIKRDTLIKREELMVEFPHGEASVRQGAIVSRALAFRAKAVPVIRDLRHGMLEAICLQEDVRVRVRDVEASLGSSAEFVLPSMTPVLTPTHFAKQFVNELVRTEEDDAGKRLVLRYLDVTGTRSGELETVDVKAIPSGLLHSLAEASKLIAAQYGWEEYEATTFILTGDAPSMVGLSVKFDEHKTCPVKSRIIMSIDPTMTVKEVELAYRRAQELLDPVKDSSSRARQRSDETLVRLWISAESESTRTVIGRRPTNPIARKDEVSRKDRERVNRAVNDILDPRFGTSRLSTIAKREIAADVRYDKEMAEAMDWVLGAHFDTSLQKLTVLSVENLLPNDIWSNALGRARYEDVGFHEFLVAESKRVPNKLKPVMDLISNKQLEGHPDEYKATFKTPESRIPWPDRIASWSDLKQVNVNDVWDECAETLDNRERID